jgi:hypothetical protein
MDMMLENKFTFLFLILSFDIRICFEFRNSDFEFIKPVCKKKNFKFAAIFLYRLYD